jgi:hypothetical protein
MPIKTINDLFKALMASTTKDHVFQILREIGDDPEMTLDVPFGPFNFSWHAFGDTSSNLSTIGLATKPGRSLTERMTNAMDAILEDRFAPGVPAPLSARAAAQQWFGRPVSGPDEGMFNWNYSEQGMDRRISVILNSSGVESAATIDVIDDGIGIRADRFPHTILSLQGGNKMNKRYVIGTFGQGGASTLRFCDFCLIVSRHRDDPNTISFTLIRELRLGEEYQVDAYAYLSLPLQSGGVTVPSCAIGAEPLSLYSGFEKLRLPLLKKGTLVRHFDYRLTKLDKALNPAPGNLYTYLHYSLFDPLFPFRIIDIRDSKSPKNELVTGSRNRLMKLVKEGKETDGDEPPAAGEQSTGSEMRHYRQMEYVVPFGAPEPCIGIEYWVVFNYKKGKQGKPPVLRADSNELFVQTGHPILGTLNGQNQGDLSASMLKDIGLSMVARHIIIHIDASKADKQTRKKLFSTNREGFTDEAELHSILNEIKKMLEEDENLQAIERELTERLTSREAEATSAEVKEQVTKLLLEAGFKVQETGQSSEPGEGQDTQPVRERRRGRYKVQQPLPTLPFPQVTRFEIVSPLPKLEVRMNDSEVMLIETNADAEYDRRDRIGIRFDPDNLEIASKAPLRGGRMRWRVRPNLNAKMGNVGNIIASITRMDGTQITQTLPYEVLAAVEDKSKKAQGQVPPFEIFPINPTDYPAEWETAWPDLDEESNPEQLGSVAYKPVQMGTKIIVYYSTIFPPYKDELEKLKTSNPAKAHLFTTNYEVWIGYHAILQLNRRPEEKVGVESEPLERIDEADRLRVARMQVKQAVRTADLQHQIARDHGQR